MTAVDIFFLEQDNRARVAESACMQTVYSIYDREFYVDAPEKACFYTGLPSVEILDVVFELVEQHDKFRETDTIQSDAPMSHSPAHELSVQGHCLSTPHLLVDRSEIYPCHT